MAKSTYRDGLARRGVRDKGELLLGGDAHLSDDGLQLVQGVGALEERFPIELGGGGGGGGGE